MPAKRCASVPKTGTTNSSSGNTPAKKNAKPVTAQVAKPVEPTPGGTAAPLATTPDRDKTNKNTTGLNDSDDDDVIAQRYVDPSWTAADLADLDDDAIVTAEAEAEIEAYEREMSQWRREHNEARRAKRGGGAAAAAAAAARNHEDPQTYRRRTSINNPSGVYTFATLIEHTLSPEVRRLGADAIAEDMVKLRTVRLESVAMEDADTLECLDAVEYLYLSDNRLRNINGLEFLQNLRVLVIAGNELTSLLPIAALELELLDARNNRVETLVEDGCCVLPITAKRLFLTGNPCVPEPGTEAHDAYVELVRETCPDAKVLDDEELPRSDDDEEEEEEEEAEDNNEDGRGADGDDAGLDFNIEEEEARMAPAEAARYSLPVADGVSSNVRTLTDDLLRRYELNTQATLRAVERANQAAVGGRAALRQREMDERDAARAQRSAAATAGGSDDANGQQHHGTVPAFRPGSAAGRPSSARMQRPSSTLAERPVGGGAVAIPMVISHDGSTNNNNNSRPSSARGRPGTAGGSGTGGAGGDGSDAAMSGATASAETHKPPPLNDNAGVGEAANNTNNDDSGSDDSSEDEAYTGVRPHAESVEQRHELQRELRFALGHQRNVAVSRLNELWDKGTEGLRRMRETQSSRFAATAAVSNDSDSASAGAVGQPPQQHSAAYQRALDRIRDYTGKVDLDKYRQQPTGPSP